MISGKNKTRRIYIRVTEKDYEKILQKADGKLSAFCRSCILAEINPLQEEKYWKELLYQIRKIGVNINQVAARINAGHLFLNDEKRLQDEMEKIERLLLTIGTKGETNGAK